MVRVADATEAIYKPPQDRKKWKVLFCHFNVNILLRSKCIRDLCRSLANFMQNFF